MHPLDAHKVQSRSRGTMQSDRLLPALDPSYVLVDEKTKAEDLAFLYEFSALVKLVDTNNAVAGNWSSMLAQDPSFVLASVATTSLQALGKAHAVTQSVLKSNPDSTAQQVALSEMMAYTTTLVGHLADWTARCPTGTALRAQLSELLCTYVGSNLLPWENCWNTMLGLMSMNPTAVTGKNLGTDVAVGMAVLGPVIQGCANAIAPTLVFRTLGDCGNYLEDLYQRLYRCNVQAIAALPPLLPASLKDPSHQPHNTLLLAFQGLYDRVRAAMNTLTQRHLDFYYREVLQLAPLGAVPCTAFVQFALSKGSTVATVPAQTPLLAGKGPSGANIVFLTDSTLTVNQSVVAQTLTVFNSGAGSLGTTDGLLNASPVANSADGWGAAFPKGALAEWPPFGFAPATAAEAQTWVGFALADPVFGMSAGARSASLALQLADADAGTLIQQLSNWLPKAEGQPVTGNNPFALSYSGPKGWVSISNWQLVDAPGPNSALASNPPAAGSCLWLEWQLASTDPAFIACDPALHGPGYPAGLPVFRFQVNSALPTEGELATSPLQNPYNLLQQVMLTGIDVQVNVRGKMDLNLQNDFNDLNPEKPFQPLGPAPLQDSNLYIGSPEAFRKQLNQLAVQVTWMNLPTLDPTGFEAYYEVWNTYSPNTPFNNSVFRVGMSLLQSGKWVDLPPADAQGGAVDYAMYALGQASNVSGGKWNPIAWLQANGWTGDSTGGDSSGGSVLQTVSTWSDMDLSGINSSITQVPADGTSPSLSYNGTQASGFLKLSLTAPYYGYGSDLFAQVSFQVNQANVTAISTAAYASPPNKPQLVPPPALPYVPTAKSLSIDYSAVSQWRPEGASASNLIAIEPFGCVPASITQSKVPLLPQYTNEGELYLGLAQVVLPQLLTILFVVDENSAVEVAGQPGPTVQWSYLANGSWTAFPTVDFLSDGTNNFSQSGIIEVQLNPLTLGASNNGGWFCNIAGSDSLLWLRATVGSDTLATCKVISVLTQAVQSTYQVSADADTVLAQALPAGSITKMENPVPGIGAVSQPMDSQGGRLGETDLGFYTRVHERLRHKERGISPWDIERILLEQFPSIGLVNCFPHSNAKAAFVAGSCLTVVFPGGSLADQANPYCPKFTLAKVLSFQQFLQGKVPHDMEVILSNPSYELLNVQAAVSFMPGLDPGTSLQRLNSDLCNFISPWVGSPGAYNPYDTLLSEALIRGFINGLDYVQHLGSLQVLHSAQSEGRWRHFYATSAYDYFQPKSPFAILTSASQHGLSLVGSTDAPNALVVGDAPAALPTSEGNLPAPKVAGPLDPLEKEYLTILLT